MKTLISSEKGDVWDEKRWVEILYKGSLSNHTTRKYAERPKNGWKKHVLYRRSDIRMASCFSRSTEDIQETMRQMPSEFRVKFIFKLGAYSHPKNLSRGRRLFSCITKIFLPCNFPGKPIEIVFHKKKKKNRIHQGRKRYDPKHRHWKKKMNNT